MQILSSLISYSGTGSISAFTGSAVAYRYDYAIAQKAFRLFGSTFESFGKSNYIGTCETRFIGATAGSKKIDYEAPKPVVIYMI